MRFALLLSAVLAGCLPTSPIIPGTSDVPDLAMGSADAAVQDVTGRIVGLDGQPLAGVTVSLCQDTCRDTTVGAQGEFGFPAVAPSFYTLRARKPGASDYANLDFPLYLDSRDNPRLLPLVLPKVGALTAVGSGAQTFAVDSTLSLALDGDKLMLPQGGPAQRLGGVRIPQSLFPNFCVPSARVLAMWAFAPTGSTSSAPIDLTLSDALGLAPGTPVSFIEIHPRDGRPAIAARGKVSADGKTIQTALGGGVHELSWLLAVVLQGGA